MDKHRYILEKYSGPSSRHTCPGCKKPREFSRYVDSSSGQHVHPDVGKCNRESRCGYHYTPSQYFNENGIKTDHIAQTYTPEPKREPSFIDTATMEQTLKGYQKNNFVSFLQEQFGNEKAGEAVEKYKIGSSKKWNGACIFWQIDPEGKIRTGKIMGYGLDGKRIKEPFNQVSWVHSELNLTDFNLKQCLFGSHLIKNGDPVCIVESEKTAVICSIVMPQFTWIATGGKNGASWSSTGSFKPLHGRNVVLYPDLGAYDDWTKKARKLNTVANISVSNILGNAATAEEYDNGLDLADYILRSVCMAEPTGEGVATGDSAPGFSTSEELAKFAEMNGTDQLTPEQMEQVGDLFGKLNPAYNQLCEVFQLQYGEPVPLSAVPF